MHQKRKTVLVVENDPDLRQLIVDFLELDYSAVAVDNADDAFHTAREIQPDLIVCDQHLPERSGLQLAQSVQRDPRLAEVPIIMLSSARSLPGAETRGLSVVPKPCPMDRLMDVVHSTFSDVPAQAP